MDTVLDSSVSPICPHLLHHLLRHQLLLAHPSKCNRDRATSHYHTAALLNQATIESQLDYCNSFVAWSRTSTLDFLECILHTEAEKIQLKQKLDPTPTLPQSLQWRPFPLRLKGNVLLRAHPVPSVIYFVVLLLPSPPLWLHLLPVSPHLLCSSSLTFYSSNMLGIFPPQGFCTLPQISLLLDSLSLFTPFLKCHFSESFNFHI